MTENAPHNEPPITSYMNFALGAFPQEITEPASRSQDFTQTSNWEPTAPLVAADFSNVAPNFYLQPQPPLRSNLQARHQALGLTTPIFEFGGGASKVQHGYGEDSTDSVTTQDKGPFPNFPSYLNDGAQTVRHRLSRDVYFDEQESAISQTSQPLDVTSWHNFPPSHLPQYSAPMNRERDNLLLSMSHPHTTPHHYSSFPSGPGQATIQDMNEVMSMFPLPAHEVVGAPIQAASQMSQVSSQHPPSTFPLQNYETFASTHAHQPSNYPPSTFSFYHPDMFGQARAHQPSTFDYGSAHGMQPMFPEGGAASSHPPPQSIWMLEGRSLPHRKMQQNLDVIASRTANVATSKQEAGPASNPKSPPLHPKSPNPRSPNPKLIPKLFTRFRRQPKPSLEKVSEKIKKVCARIFAKEQECLARTKTEIEHEEASVTATTSDSTLSISPSGEKVVPERRKRQNRESQQRFRDKKRLNTLIQLRKSLIEKSGKDVKPEDLELPASFGAIGQVEFVSQNLSPDSGDYEDDLEGMGMEDCTLKKGDEQDGGDAEEAGGHTSCKAGDEK